MRFPIRRSLVFALHLLFFMGATGGRRYLELTDDTLVLRFGWLCHHSFPLDEIKEATLIPGTVSHGPGWRTSTGHEGHGVEYGATFYSRGFINLVFVRGDVVDLRFKRPQRVRMLLPRVSCERLAASLEDPEAFLQSLDTAGVRTTRVESSV